MKQRSSSFEQKVIQSNDLEFWAETFGKKSDLAILLIMGSGNQGLLWPQEFCEQLASRGYFVIRFDNRDTGLSSSIDYQQSPYTLLNMVEDGIVILNHYGIEKAHFVGASMGGIIAILAAAHHPDRVHSLTLMMTTTDSAPMFNALQGKSSSSVLSKPTQAILDAAKSLTNPPKTLDEKVEKFIKMARIKSGSKVPINEELCRQMALQSFVRMRNPAGINNHFLAMQASYELHSQALSKIAVPTSIIHGDQDPIFPLDHAYALNQAIAHSTLTIIPGMGHGITSTQFYDPIIEKIKEVIEQDHKIRAPA